MAAMMIAAAVLRKKLSLRYVIHGSQLNAIVDLMITL
jgi:hypothetical protein